MFFSSLKVLLKNILYGLSALSGMEDMSMTKVTDNIIPAAFLSQEQPTNLVYLADDYNWLVLFLLLLWLFSLLKVYSEPSGDVNSPNLYGGIGLFTRFLVAFKLAT